MLCSLIIVSGPIAARSSSAKSYTRRFPLYCSLQQLCSRKSKLVNSAQLPQQPFDLVPRQSHSSPIHARVS